MTYRPAPRRRWRDPTRAADRPRHETASVTADVVGEADYTGWQAAYAEDKRRGGDDHVPDWRRYL